MDQAGQKRAWWQQIVLLVLLALWALRPFGVDAPPSLDTEFDAERAIGRLATILGDQRPHPTGTATNDAVLERLIGEIRKTGLAPDVRERFHCNDIRKGAAICAKPRNVRFWVTAPGRDAVLIAAHYDSVPAGPGAADDGIGVAVALEVAHLLKREKLDRPVLVLLSDAEEAGLVGAAEFAAHDPLAKTIGAVVNLEARGTTGSANMFQTSDPNGNDVAALLRGGFVPSANSLATNLYEHMPNDTDLTMLLPLGIDAANYAVIGGGKRYHTPLDNLAYLDPRSVRHMGAEALSAVRGFAGVKREAPEQRYVFTDVGRAMLLALPLGLAALCLALGGIAATILYVRAGAGLAWRTVLTPPLAVIAGTGLAIATGALVAAVRLDDAFASAYPVALRVAYGAAAITGVLFTVRWLRVESMKRLALAAWIWLTALIGAAFAFAPGLASLVVWPLIFIVAAAAASFLPSIARIVPALLGVAAAVFIFLTLPLAGGLEDALFIENAGIGAVLLVFMALFTMAASGDGKLVWAAILLLSTGVALLVPAYSDDVPRHLSVVHEDKDGKAAFLVYDNGPLPGAMASAAAFATQPDKDGNWHAAAPRLADDGAVRIVSDEVAAGVRTLVIRVEAPLADRQELLVEKGEGVRSVAVNGAFPTVRGPLAYIGCTGFACRDLEVTLRLSAKAPLPELIWQRTRYGAGAAASRLVAARPRDAQPVHVGDRQSLVRPIKWPDR